MIGYGETGPVITKDGQEYSASYHIVVTQAEINAGASMPPIPGMKSATGALTLGNPYELRKLSATNEEMTLRVQDGRSNRHVCVNLRARHLHQIACEAISSVVVSVDKSDAGIEAHSSDG